jgi:hypothetical protein
MYEKKRPDVTITPIKMTKNNAKDTTEARVVTVSTLCSSCVGKRCGIGWGNALCDFGCKCVNTTCKCA